MAPAREPTGAHELTLTRLIDAPPAVVFEVWTTPEHLAAWWGPERFTLPECEIAFRVGGAFRFHMQGPQGEHAWLRGVFREIVEPRRIVFTAVWGDHERSTGAETVVTVTFEALGVRTKVTVHQVGLESEPAVRAHEEGWAHQFERLGAYAPSVELSGSETAGEEKRS